MKMLIQWLVIDELAVRTYVVHRTNKQRNAQTSSYLNLVELLCCCIGQPDI